jgi:hypothetical protein
MKSMSSAILMAALAVLFLCASAEAKGASYSFKCEGQDDAGHPAGTAGVMAFTSATNAIGDVQINLSNGIITMQENFTATFVNGTAAADGSGGNGIPTGCFTAALSLTGDTFGVMEGLFGCYTKGKKGFNAVQSVSGTLTCEAEQM